MKITELKPLSFDQVNAAIKNPASLFADELLEWVAGQETLFIEDSFSIAGKNIFRFQGTCNNNGKVLHSFGRSENRKIAAVKAVAELIERVVFHYFTKNEIGLNLKLMIEGGEWQVYPSENEFVIEKSFYNSNGWAVDFSIEGAIERAMREAMERHILLLSFAKEGWCGLYEINDLAIENYKFRSLISKYTVNGFSAGIAICQSPSFSGASLGYLSDRNKNILISSRWEQAFYEAFDYMQMQEIKYQSPESTNLIYQEMDSLLQKPFNIDFQKSGDQKEIHRQTLTGLAVLNLQRALYLPFPLYAAVVHGGDLLPLYFYPRLTEKGHRSLKKNLELWGVHTGIPESHPVL